MRALEVLRVVMTKYLARCQNVFHFLEREFVRIAPLPRDHFLQQFVQRSNNSRVIWNEPMIVVHQASEGPKLRLNLRPRGLGNCGYFVRWLM